MESVNRKPSENPPGTAELLPRTPPPTEFEVATVKPTSPDSRRSLTQTSTTGRFTSEGLPFTLLVQRAFNPAFSSQLVGMPAWANTARFDVVAQAPEGVQVTDPEVLGSMMLGLLKDRFKLTYHTEQREMQAFDLVADKPKMKKADPAARSWCKSPAQVPGAPPAPSGSQAMICQNITMTQFAELLRGRSPDLQVPIADSTGLGGGWDFTLTFNPLVGLQLAAAVAREGAGAPSPIPSASEPTAGISVMDAVEKQLGLKLQKTKRMVEVTVIDHIEQTPTEN